MKKRLYIDMDEVLCRFIKKGLEIKRKFPNIQYPQSQVGFFSRLEPVEGSIEAVNKLNDVYDIWILTRPSFFNLHCYTEKAEWIREHLGFEMQKKLILCGNKSLVKGDYLIDDSITDGQLEFEGELLQFKTDKFPDWNAVLDYLL